MDTGRIAKALCALALLISPGVVAHGAQGPRCEPAGRFLATGAPILSGGLTTGGPDAVVIGPGQLEILSGCGTEDLRIRKFGIKKNYTRVIAGWKGCADGSKLVRLDGKIKPPPDCDTLVGKIVIRRGHGFKPEQQNITFKRSECGDNVFDPGGEDC